MLVILRYKRKRLLRAQITRFIWKPAFQCLYIFCGMTYLDLDRVAKLDIHCSLRKHFPVDHHYKRYQTEHLELQVQVQHQI